MPNSNTWQHSGAFPVTQANPQGWFMVASALLSDGLSVLVTGGTQTAGNTLGTRDCYVWADGAMTRLGATMTHARFGHTATAMSDGRVLIAGSAASERSTTPIAATAELYDPATGRFSATPAMSVPRSGHTATWLPGTKQVLIAGGVDPAPSAVVTPPYGSAELYGLASGSFAAVAAPMKVPRQGHTATLLQDGRVLIAGGVSDAAHGFRQASAELYDPQTHRFTACGAMAIARQGHAAALLADGRVVITGGYEYGSSSAPGYGGPCDELFDPATGAFTPVAPVQKSAYGATLSTLADGRVLALGGMVGGSVWNATIDDHWWIFDPAVKPPAFVQAGSVDRVAWHTATVLANGSVFVIGCKGVLGTIPPAGLLFWPKVFTLQLRFKGGGKGTVTVLPGGRSYSAAVDLPMAQGVHLTLAAQPAAPYSSIGMIEVPATKLRPRHWVKGWILHRFAFDGWGQAAPFDTRPMLDAPMASNRLATANFSLHDAPGGPVVPLP